MPDLDLRCSHIKTCSNIFIVYNDDRNEKSMMEKPYMLLQQKVHKTHKRVIALLMTLLSLLSVCNAHAACESNVTFKAQSSVTYKKTGFGSSSSPKPEIFREASPGPK